MAGGSRSGEALARLLEHPALWRGTSAARTPCLSTGFPELDERLPGGGWPRSGLIEILIPRLGCGELFLLVPALAALSRESSARWCAWIAPPFEPFAPALAAHGVALERVFVARGAAAGWAFEQSLRSGACEIVLAWLKKTDSREIRRLQLAAEHGHTLGVLFRRLRTGARESSAAMMRMAVEPTERGANVTLLKSRGGRHGAVQLCWHEAQEEGRA